MKRKCSKVILVLLVFCFACYSSSWANPFHKYTIKHLTLGGTWGTAIAINERGQVVGTSQIPGDASHHGFIYHKGTITDIGRIYPYNINNLGQVVGHYNTEIDGDSTVRSFIYSNGTLADLGTISSDSRAQSWANGINDFGQVVGSANTVYVGSRFHAYFYGNGVMEDIDTIGPDYEQSEAWVINNRGMVVGSERDGGVFLYSDGVMRRLNILGNAFDMNDRGEFVGFGSWGPGLRGAFLYREGEFTALGDLGDSGHTAPRAINESSQIVGQSDIGYVERPWGYSHIGHAFLYDNGLMTDLNTLIPANSGWELMYATDINNRGQIVGYGVRDGKFQRVCYEDDSDTYCYNFPVYSAFLLTPILEVTIDSKPWWNSNSVNLRETGIIPVAVLSTKNFCAPKMLNRNTLTFGAKGNEKSLSFCSSIDVNRDGYRDLLCFFYNETAGFHCGNTKGILKGKTVDGMPIEGRDTVKIVPCR
jgi:probable HAF family extracellular repeat protein